MEDHEANTIKKNFSKLIERTRCSSELLAFLISKEVIAFADFDELDSITNESAKSMKFYRIMMTKANSFELLLNALKETKQTGALSILTGEEDLSGKPAANNKCIRFDVSDPVPNFSGRASELLDLHEKIKGDKDVTNTKFHTVSVLGLGGIGKTELCRRYIHKYSDYFDGNLIWIDAHREAAILKCFQRLAEHHLQLSISGSNGKEKEAKTIVDEVYQSFAGQKCLFVFDNADCVDYLKTYLPIRVLNPNSIHVLITSRNKEWDMAGSFVVLNEMTDADGIEFVQNELSVDLNDERQLEDVCQLTHILQQFPLALQQCVCFIKQQRRVASFSISDYIDLFESNKKRLLLNSRIPTSIFGNYSETTFTTWQITTNMIQNDKEFGSTAIKILNIISYFESEMIPLQILRAMHAEDKTAISLAVELLVRYSMVNSQPGKATFSIHKLVQDVTKEHLREENNEVHTLRVALNLLDKRLTNGTVFHAISAYFDAVQYKELVIEFSSLPWVIICGFGQRYMYNHAKDFKNIALQHLHMHLTCNHIDILRTELHWGNLEFLYGNYENCLSIFENLLMRYQSHSLADNFKADISCVKHYIASTSLALGRLTNSLSLAAKSLKFCKTINGDNCRDTIISLQLVARNLEDMGLLSDALSIYKHCIKSYKLIDKPELSRNILATMQDKALLYFKIGRLDKTFYTVTEILKSGPKNLYKTDVTFNETGNILSHYFYTRGQYVVSTRIAYEVYTLQKEVFGDEHVRTLNSLSILAHLKYGFQRSDDALLIQEYVYSKLKQRYGQFHRFTLAAKCNMCETYSKMGMHDEALGGFKEILDTPYQNQMPNKVVFLTKAQLAFGRAQMRVGKFNEALNMFIELERTLKGKFGEKHYELKNLREDIKLLRTEIQIVSVSNHVVNNLEWLVL